MIDYTDAEADQIHQTWQKYAPPAAQVAVDAATERGERWAIDTPVHHDMAHTYWRAQAGLQQQGLTITNAAAIEWASEHLDPPGQPRRAWVDLIADTLTFLRANPPMLANGIWGVRQPRLEPEQSRRYQRGDFAVSMRQDHLIQRLRYHQRRTTGGAWWSVLSGAITAVETRWTTCWPHVWQAASDPRWTPREQRAESTASLIDAVGKVAAENLRPPARFASWEDVIRGEPSGRLGPGIHILGAPKGETVQETLDRTRAEFDIHNLLRAGLISKDEALEALK